MAFPSVVETTSYVSGTTNSTSWTPFSGKTVAVGEMLVFFASVDGVVPTLSTASSGWSKLTDIVSSGRCGAVFYKVADSTTDTLAISSTASEQYSGILYRLSGADSISATALGLGLTSSPDPPSHDAGASRDHLWITSLHTSPPEANTASAPTAPTGFGSIVSRPGGSTTGAATFTAHRTASNQTEDPDAWSASPFTRWGAFTIAAWGTAPAGNAISGSIAFTGSGAATVSLSGSTSGTIALTGSSAGAVANSATVTGNIDFTGAAEGGAATAISGDASGSIALTGASAGTVTVQGAGSGDLDFTGSGAGAVAVAGAASGDVDFTGLASGGAAVSAATSGDIDFAGASAGGVAVSGDGSGSFDVTGDASGAVQIAADASGTIDFTGTATTSGATKGSTSGSISLSGASAATVAVDGAASGQIALTGVSGGAVALYGGASSAIEFAGASAGKVAVAAAANDEVAFGGTASASGDNNHVAGEIALTGGATGTVVSIERYLATQGRPGGARPQRPVGGQYLRPETEMSKRVNFASERPRAASGGRR